MIIRLHGADPMHFPNQYLSFGLLFSDILPFWELISFLQLTIYYIHFFENGNTRTKKKSKKNAF